MSDEARSSDDTTDSDGEPVAPFEFEVVSSRLTAQIDRIDKVDTKIAAVIAALIAAVGFAVLSDKTALDYLLSLLFLIPLGFAVYAFQTKLWDDAPDPRYFTDHYSDRPNDTTRAAIKRMVTAYESNRGSLARKCVQTDLALWLAVASTTIILATRLGEAWSLFEVQIGNGKQIGQPTNVVSTPTASATASGSAQTAPAKPNPKGIPTAHAVKATAKP